MNDKKTVSFGMALAIIFLPILVILLGGLVLPVGFLVPVMRRCRANDRGLAPQHQGGFHLERG